MKIVGCDLHTRYQQVAMLDKETGELIERRLEHESGEARAFYAGCPRFRSLKPGCRRRSDLVGKLDLPYREFVQTCQRIRKPAHQ